MMHDGKCGSPVIRCVLFGAVLAMNAACLRATTFTCAEDTQCSGAGPQAACDPQANVCTFMDTSCPSMRRYSENAGSLSGECVGGGGTDGGVDGTMTDGPVGNCPAGFMALPNSGPRGHRYLLIDTPRAWPGQRDACVAAMGFLAFPDGASLVDATAELNAVRALAGDGAWFGINDITTEGTYQTSLNQPASAITQMLLVTGGGNPDQQDCLRGSGSQLDDEDCQQTRKAACECVP